MIPPRDIAAAEAALAAENDVPMKTNPTPDAGDAVQAGGPAQPSSIPGAATASAAPEFPDGLDFEVRATGGGEWEIWTPAFDGETGACLGFGATEHQARLNAARNLEAAVDAILGRDRRALNPTAAELFAAMRAKRVWLIEVICWPEDQDHFTVFDGEDVRLLKTRRWSEVLHFLGLHNPDPVEE
jgi:hypothetical protein